MRSKADQFWGKLKGRSQFSLNVLDGLLGSLLPGCGVNFGDVSTPDCTYYCSSVLVAEWPPLRKELLIRLTICSL